jgi:hypothetical protein
METEEYEMIQTGMQRQKKVTGKVHPCTGTEALYRPFGPYGE